MREQPVGELRLEPGGLRGHHFARVGHRHQVLEAGRVERERGRHLAGVDPLLELAESAAAADEIDALVGAQVADAEERRQHAARQQARVEPPHRIGRLGQAGPRREPVPVAAAVQTELPVARGSDRPLARGHVELRAELREQLVPGQPAEIAHHAVVVEDPQLVVRKGDDEEPLVAPVRTAAAVCSDARSSRRAVMAVGDIDRRHRVEQPADPLDHRGVADRPDRVADAAVGDHVGLRRAARELREQRVERRRRGIRGEHRPGLRVQRLHVAHPVVLLVRPRELVLADAVRVVRRHRRGDRDAGLHEIAESESVDVVRRRCIAHQHARITHAGEVLGALRIDRARERVGARRQVDLGLGDVQKAPRLARGAGTRLVARKDVVGRGGDLGGARGRGA